MRFPAVSLIVLTAALAALPARADDPAPTSGPESAYGLYLAGRSAMTHGEAGAAADFLATVQALEPDEATLREQAFTSALLAGDLDLAARIAPNGEGAQPVMVEIGRLVAAVRGMVLGDAATANASLAAAPIQAPHSRAGMFVAPWIAAAAGDWERALAVASPDADPLSTVFIRLHRSQLLEINRRFADAEAELQALSAAGPAASVFAGHYGEFLERRGRRDDALAVYDAALAADPDNTPVAAKRARVLARVRPPVLPTLAQGASRALSAAAAAAVNERANEFAVVYLRLALGLDDNDETRTLLGQTLQGAGLEVASRAALSQVGADNPELYASSRLSMAFSLQEDGMDEAALAEVRRAHAAAPDDARVTYALASLLIEQETYDEGLALLNGPVLNTPSQGWDVRFLRGAAYESMGRIPEAEAELWAALEAKPDDPNTLNYLGYLWVDSGARVHQGAEMIARAAAAMPENGNFQDSLGWAQFRQGQYEQAVATLEGAVEKEPANAEINDHLGDAYWHVGRQREAGFQWSRVLTLEPDAERRADVEKKLVEGLTGPIAPVAVAANP